MAHSFRFLYWKVCCYVCTRKPKKSRIRRSRTRRITNSRHSSRHVSSNSLQMSRWSWSNSFQTLENRLSLLETFPYSDVMILMQQLINIDDEIWTIIDYRTVLGRPILISGPDTYPAGRSGTSHRLRCSSHCTVRSEPLNVQPIRPCLTAPYPAHPTPLPIKSPSEFCF